MFILLNTGALGFLIAFWTSGAVTGCDLKEASPSKLITKWSELRHAEKLYKKGIMDKAAMHRQIQRLLRSGWKLSSLEAWDFNARCKWRLATLR